MEQLSKLELERLLEIIDEGLAVCDDVFGGVTEGYEDSLEEARLMVVKALKMKNGRK